MKTVIPILLVLALVSCYKQPTQKQSNTAHDQSDHTQSWTNINVDTTRTLFASLLGDSSTQVILCRLTITDWSEPVRWRQAVLLGNDTLKEFEGSFKWADFMGLDEPDTTISQDSVLSNIRAWFFKHMPPPTSTVIGPADERRQEFKMISLGRFQESLAPLGYSPKSIEGVHASFWANHLDSDIICIVPPIEPVPEGDEAIYVYLPSLRRIVEFYRP